MPSYTLLCGHRHDLKDVVIRSITDKPGRAVCHVCKVPFTSEEGCYLAYCDTTKMSLSEFTRAGEEALARRRSTEMAVVPSLPTCSGICKSGKQCTKTSMRSSGVFCNLHIWLKKQNKKGPSRSPERELNWAQNMAISLASYKINQEIKDKANIDKLTKMYGISNTLYINPWENHGQTWEKLLHASTISQSLFIDGLFCVAWPQVGYPAPTRFVFHKSLTTAQRHMIHKISGKKRFTTYTERNVITGVNVLNVFISKF